MIRQFLECWPVSTIAEHFMIYLILPSKTILLIEWWLCPIGLIMWIASVVWAYKRGKCRRSRELHDGVSRAISGLPR